MSIMKPINQGLKINFIFDDVLKISIQKSAFIDESQNETCLI